MLDWIETAGGPLLCGAADIATHWRGIEGSSIGRARSDYDRGCDVLDYVGKVPCGSGEVLLLGDEPLRSALYFVRDTPIVARWWACESEEQAEAALREIPVQLPSLEDSVSFAVPTATLIMFDAARSGAEPAPYRRVDIPIGMYLVTSETYERSRSFRFLVHRFLWQ